ncbi:Biofilm growth-associated repressor [Kordia antarctica]|uniref:Biofilm growth-associated repressor n=1 Tax=Kordia antarctica TaxID=1218801 RepID=A0A7L4ZMR1_9FLAO|nr:metalloregulator ArsR/SmtB family transcription factor [Kordia antarctica]QHI38008.1 Biofilm growth-associated repressor [Kordia antarctica]
MGITKNHIFDDYQNETASITKVLGHPARIAILQYISENEYCNCNDLVKATGLAQPTISQHLSEIKRIKLLKQKSKGKNTFYTIDVDLLNQYRRKINDFFVKLQVSCQNKS